jgi:hypothetical protein
LTTELQVTGIQVWQAIGLPKILEKSSSHLFFPVKIVSSASQKSMLNSSSHIEVNEVNAVGACLSIHAISITGITPITTR